MLDLPVNESYLIRLLVRYLIYCFYFMYYGHIFFFLPIAVIIVVTVPLSLFIIKVICCSFFIT